MTKKNKNINKNLQSSIRLHLELSQLYNTNYNITIPSLELIQQLLKDNQGNCEQTKDLLMKIIEEQLVAFHKAESIIDITSDNIDERDVDLSNQYLVFIELMSELLDETHMNRLWDESLSNNHSFNKNVLEYAINNAFDYLQQLQDMECHDSNDKFNEMDTKNMALLLMMDRFEVKNTETSMKRKIQTVLVECHYDIDHATQVLDEILNKDLLDNESLFPELHDSMIYSKFMSKHDFNDSIRPVKPVLTYLDAAFENQTSKTSSRCKNGLEILKRDWKPQIIVQDVNVNQRLDGNHKQKFLTEAHYWRNISRMECNQMKHKFQIAANSYLQKKGSIAGHLSTHGYEYQRQMNIANNKAALCLLKANNPMLAIGLNENHELQFISCELNSSKRLQFDLHGLTYKEAIGFLESFLSISYSQSIHAKVVLIVGMGNHSVRNVPVLAPRLQHFMSKQGIDSHLKEGELIFQI